MFARRAVSIMNGQAGRGLELLLRLGVAGCFIGHGAFGVIGKAAWLPYFAVVGIGEDLAWRLMPIIGTIDIVVGILVLIKPHPAFLIYAIGWSIWTALLRPLAGESVFEALERAGNYGVPIALFALVAAKAGFGIHAPILARFMDGPADRRRAVAAVLRATTVMLLAGHGGLALLGNPLIVAHLTAVGMPAGSAFVVGSFEIALAATVAFRPLGAVLALVVAWKLATEALYPLTGAPVWEFIERAGSYAAPLALWVLVRQPARAPRAVPAPVRWGAITAAATILLGSLHAAGFAATRAPDWQRAPASVEPDDSLLDRLRAGGFVLACRHAITGPDPSNRRLDLADRSTQRLLSPEGESQARRLGDILRRQRIPIGEVFTSPLFRTSDSAELTFGEAEASDALYDNSPGQQAALRRLFTGNPPAGTNRALMTHQGVLYRIMPELERGSIREGDCVIVEPDGRDGFEIIDRLGPDDWASLRAVGAQETEAARAIAAARRGGTMILCRHAITDSKNEVEPVDYDDVSTQRLLSAEGERQSKAIGLAFRRLGIPIGDVVASPMHRARRTAELMAGRAPIVDSIWHTNGSDYSGPPLALRARVLATPVNEGNRLIISHIGTMISVIPQLRGRVDEGDCVIVLPAGEDFDIVGIVPARTWTAVD